jgi:folate-binding protein YgfZ
MQRKFIELDRGKIAVTGEDRVRWLHGMVTNDVKGLAPWTGCYCFVLDAQGRVQSDCNVFMETERLIVDCEAQFTGKLFAVFDHFIIMDQVELSDISKEMGTLAVVGALPDTTGLLVYPTPIATYLWGPHTRLAQLAAGSARISAEEYEAVRIEAGIPRYGVDIDETTIANETGIERAMNYNKGCYIGQEIVERVRSRGHVNRMLSKFCSAGMLSAPAVVEVDGKEVGRTTSATGGVALGYLRREFARPGTTVIIAGILAEVA